MSIEDYIKNNFSEKQLNQYSLFSGWHDAILEIVRNVWNDAQRNIKRDELWLCTKCESCNIGLDDKCWSCGETAIHKM
jgi:hypothetical protein